MWSVPERAFPPFAVLGKKSYPINAAPVTGSRFFNRWLLFVADFRKPKKRRKMAAFSLEKTGEEPIGPRECVNMIYSVHGEILLSSGKIPLATRGPWRHPPTYKVTNSRPRVCIPAA